MELSIWNTQLIFRNTVKLYSSIRGDCKYTLEENDVKLIVFSPIYKASVNHYFTRICEGHITLLELVKL
jgi:hypothetical protein